MLWNDVIYPRFRGMPLIPTLAASVELERCNLTLPEVVYILENGFDCSASQRKKEVVERCVMVGKKQLKAVAIFSYNYSLQTDCWALVHVGLF